MLEAALMLKSNKNTKSFVVFALKYLWLRWNKLNFIHSMLVQCRLVLFHIKLDKFSENAKESSRWRQQGEKI